MKSKGWSALGGERHAGEAPPTASICVNYSVGPTIRPFCTRCRFTMTDMIQVCSNFRRWKEGWGALGADRHAGEAPPRMNENTPSLNKAGVGKTRRPFMKGAWG